MKSKREFNSSGFREMKRGVHTVFLVCRPWTTVAYLFTRACAQMSPEISDCCRALEFDTQLGRNCSLLLCVNRHSKRAHLWVCCRASRYGRYYGTVVLISMIHTRFPRCDRLRSMNVFHKMPSDTVNQPTYSSTYCQSY